MDMNSDGLLGLLKERMSYLSKRQAVLAENVANETTPGYKPKDLAPFSFHDTLHQVSTGMMVTDPRHITPASMSGVNASAKAMKSFETLPSGNAVDVEQQMMLVSQTTIDHQEVASLYHKIMGWFRIAVKGS